MLGIKADLFENGMSKMDVVAKLPDIAEVGDKPVIPYSNLAGALLPATGTQLKFKGHDKNGKLVKNGVYDVTLIHARQGKDAGKEFVAVDGVLFKRKDFVSPQATTGHASQGDTIDEPYVILEANHFYASVGWFYTAVTRCTRLAAPGCRTCGSTLEQTRRAASRRRLRGRSSRTSSRTSMRGAPCRASTSLHLGCRRR